MDKEALEKQIILITQAFEQKIFQDIDICKTKPGLRFQQELKDLVTLTTKINAYPTFFSIFKRLILKIKSYLADSKKNQSNIINLSDKTNETESDFFSQILLSMNFDPEMIFLNIVQNDLPLFTDALNNYFILALYSYMDYYWSTLYTLLEQTLGKKELTDLLHSRPQIKNNYWKIDYLLVTLPIISGKEFNRTIKNQSWFKTFNKICKLRHLLAHETPNLKKETLNKKFPILTANVRDSLFKQDEDYDENNLQIKGELRKEDMAIINSRLETIYLMVEIAKHCFAYIAIIDFLVAAFLKKQVEKK